MPRCRLPPVLPLLSALLPGVALACASGTVFEDRNGDGVRQPGEPGIAGVAVSDGRTLATSGADGRYRGLPRRPGQPVFVVKPAGHAVALRADGLPDFWKPGGGRGGRACDFALRPEPPVRDTLEVLVFSDPQAGTLEEVDYYARAIVAPAGRHRGAALGLTLGDVVNDDMALFPAVNRATARLGLPWLHAAGNHDVAPDAVDDAGSLRAFQASYGPDTFAWEQGPATFVVLDNVVVRPGQRPAYVAGLRDDQFAFLERYLPTIDPGRRVVVAAHMPWFDTAASGRAPTVRAADRERLFALLQRFPRVLLLSGHRHTQRQFFHDAATGWHGPQPLREANVGAASGAYWSGAAAADGIPDATMADGTPKGYATLRILGDGGYRLRWHPARVDADDPASTEAMALHAPKLLRRGAYPAWGVYANVYMGHAATRVEYRIGGGDWMPMSRVSAPDPRLLLENTRDDLAETLRGRDRSPEAEPSTHLWRGALDTRLPTGPHRVEVRAFDDAGEEQRASIVYRLADYGAP